MVPIRRVIRNKKLLDLLESQFCKSCKLGVDLVCEDVVNNRPWFKRYNVYEILDGRYVQTRFKIEKLINNGKTGIISFGEIFILNSN